MRMKVFLSAIFLLSCTNQEKAINAANIWATQQKKALGEGAKVIVSGCQDTDGDQNGYCSCDILVSLPGVAPVYPNVECACGWLQPITDGCKQKNR